MARIPWVVALLLLLGCAPSTAPDVAVDTTLPLRAARTTGFDGEVLRLGVLVDLSGPAAVLDQHRLAGIETFWAEVNARGGYDGRVAVELVVRDHGGDPELAVELLGTVVGEIAAVAYASEGVVDAIRPVALAADLLVVAGSPTIAWEADLALLTAGVPLDLVPIALADADPAVQWCVVTDDQPNGVRVRRSLEAAERVVGSGAELLPVAESGVIVEAVAEAGCAGVYVEAGAALVGDLVAGLPEQVRLAGRSSVLFGATIGRTDVLMVDDGPLWGSDVSEGMGTLLAALERHTPDVSPDPRVREGFVTGLWLDALLVEGFGTGDVGRSRLLDLATVLGPIDFDGLAPSIDVAAEPPVLARQIRMYELADGEWSYLGAHRAGALDAIAAAVLAGG